MPSSEKPCDCGVAVGRGAAGVWACRPVLEVIATAAITALILNFIVCLRRVVANSYIYSEIFFRATRSSSRLI